MTAWSYVHPDGCVGCQRVRRTVPFLFTWWQSDPFVLRLCISCTAGFVFARRRRRRDTQ